jgi:hypothetical protein
MNATFGRALVVAVPVLVLLGLSWLRFIRTDTWSARLQLLGASCLVVVVLAHVAEAWHWFPGMGWGEPHTIGHYLDLVSAAAGVTLLLLALVLTYVRLGGLRK